jgi:hypothetical protein
MATTPRGSQSPDAIATAEKRRARKPIVTMASPSVNRKAFMEIELKNGLPI